MVIGLKLQNVLSQGWLYRGEGNANIVLWLPKTNQILRLRKTKKPKNILQWLFDWLVKIFKWDYNRQIEHEVMNLNFYNFVMMRLLGEVYVSPAKGILTTKEDIGKLNKELMIFRPAHRKNKYLQYGTAAALLRDCAFLSAEWSQYQFESVTYAIEIKPKQGWIPLGDRNIDKCQFCLNQYLKMKAGKIKKMSSYCPLDLFSGHSKRMMKALTALIDNPQNNFRVFRDGTYYYGEDIPLQKFYNLLRDLFNDPNGNITSLLNKFNDLIIQSLLKDFKKNGCDNICDFTYNNLEVQNRCLFSEQILPKGCVLERILSVQKLNCLAFYEYCDMDDGLTKNNPKKFDDWSYIKEFLKHMMLENKKPENILMEIEEKGWDDLCDLSLAPYLIASVANDCSFMVTFRKLKCKSEDRLNNYVIETSDGNFLVNIGIFDLYPKPRSTIKKHIRRNKQILDAYKYNK